MNYDWREWESGRVPRQPEPIHSCDVCGGDAGDWRVIDETRWTIACPECAADAEDADPSADRGDWEFHRDHDQ